MAQMSVAMQLTLSDAASAPLRAFTALVDQLEAAAARVTPRLAAAAAELTRFASPTASAGVSALTSAIASLQGQVAGLTGALGAATTAYGALGAASATTGGAMNQHLAATNAQANTLGTTLKGIAELWAAVKIEKGLKESAQEAMAFQNTETRLKTMNVSPSDQKEMIDAAERTSKLIPQFNKNDMLTMAIDLRNATGSVEEAIHMLPEFARAAFNMKMATPEGKTFKEGDMLLIAKALEQRNATQDPARMSAELDMFTKIYAATQGRIDAQQILGNLQYSRGGLGQTMDIGFLPMFAAMMEQVKSGGGNGGQVGTGLTAMQKYVMGNVANGMSAKAAADLGLLDPSKLVYNSQGNINLKKSELTMAGGDQFQANPYQWVVNFLKPALERAGVDLLDNAAVNKVLTRLFPAGTANSMASMMVTRGSLLEKDSGLINQSLGNEAAYAENIKTATAAVTEFKAQLENLAIVMGTTLLPVISSVAHAFADGFQWLAHFFTDHPIIAQLATWAAAIASVGLALAGFAALFGGLPILGAAFTAVGVVIADVVAGIVAVIGGPLTIAIGLLVVAWKAGLFEWIGSLEISGKTIKDWAIDIAGSVATAFQNGWLRVKGFLGLIDDASMQAGIRANNAARASGGGSVSGSWSEATGSWAPTSGESISAAMAAAGGGTNQRRGRLFAGGAGTDDAFTKAGSRFKNYNAGADLAGNEFKREEDAAKADQKQLDAIYKQGLLSIADYYGGKQELLNVSVEMERTILEREKAAFQRAGDMAGVNRVDTQLSALKSKLDTETENNAAGRAQAMNKLRKDALDMERAMMTTSGQRRAAEALHVEEELAGKLKVLVLNKAISQELADAMMARAKVATELKLRSEEIGKIQSQYADQLAVIAVAERNGTLSQTASEDEKLRLRKEEAEVMEQELRLQLALAEKSENDVEVLRIKKQLRGTAAVKAELPADDIAVLKSAQAGFGNFFNSILRGTSSIKDAFRNLGHTILDTVTGIISKRLGDALFDSLFGAFFGGSGGAMTAASGGGGGLFGGLLGSIFGGGGYGFGGTGFGASALATDGGVGAALAAGIAPLAKGMDYVPNDMLAVIHKGERVMTAADNANYGGGRSQVNHINISPPPGMTRQNATQLGASIAQRLALADRRNN